MHVVRECAYEADWTTGGAGFTHSRAWASEPPCGSRTLKRRRTHTAPSQLSHWDNLLVGVGGWVGTFAVCFEQEMTGFLEGGVGGEMIRKRVENALTCVYEQKGIK